MNDRTLPFLLSPFPPAFADRPALVTIDGQVVDFARLARTIASFCGHAVREGIRPGDRIAIEVPNEAVRLCLIFALSRIGAVAVAGAAADDLLKGGVPLAGVITQKIGYRQEPRIITFNQTWFEPSTPEPQGVSPRALDPATPCLVMSSSGSTGLKKFMEFSFALLEQRLEWDRTVFGDVPQNRLITLGIGTDFGLRQALRTLQQGRLFMRPGSTPVATMELIRKHQINELVTTPLILNDLVSSLEVKPVSLPSLGSVITVGGPIAGHLAQRAGEMFGTTVTNVYGSTETGLIAVAQGNAWFGREGASGPVMPWIDLEIVDGSGTPQPAETSGEVRVRLDRRFSVERYLNADTSDDEPIRDGWFYPGDLGALSKSRELTIAGRTRELVNIGGTKLSPAAIEDRLRSIRGIAQLAVVGLRNQAGYDDVGLVLCRSSGTPLSAISEAIGQRLGKCTHVRIIEVEMLPATQSGKIDRMRLKEIFEGS